MKVLDLFSGAAGGWSLGLHRAGFVTVAACEIDPQRRAAYANNNPGVRLYDDVRTLTASRLLVDLGSLPDCVVGSPPCQDASTANHRGKGIDGERTGLFREYVRIVEEVRPRWCAAENVPGIRTRGADWVLDALEAIGYACWPLVVGAVHAGAPHLRRRVWFIAADAAQVERRQPRQPSRPVSRGAERATRCGSGELGGSEDAADADALGVRVEPGRRGRSDGPGAAVAANDPHAERDDEHGVAVDGEVGRALGADAGDPDEARLALGQGERGDHAAQLAAVERAGEHAADPDEDQRSSCARDADFAGHIAAIERATGTRGILWHGGPARHLGMAAGLPPGLARACVAAYGDSVLPQITEAIGNAIRRTDQAMRAAA